MANSARRALMANTNDVAGCCRGFTLTGQQCRDHGAAHLCTQGIDPFREVFERCPAGNERVHQKPGIFVAHVSGSSGTPEPQPRIDPHSLGWP